MTAERNRAAEPSVMPRLNREQFGRAQSLLQRWDETNALLDSMKDKQPDKLVWIKGDWSGLSHCGGRDLHIPASVLRGWLEAWRERLRAELADLGVEP